MTLVCLNFPPEPTGIAVYSGGLASGLAARGLEVQVVTGLPHYPQWRRHEGYRPGTQVDPDGVRVTRAAHTVPENPKLVNRLLMELTFGVSSALSRWREPDVVVLISPALFGSLFAGLRAVVTRRPYVVWVQDIYTLGVSETGRGGNVAARALARAERLLLQRAAGVVVIHDRFKSYLVNQLEIDESRVSVVRNWSHVAVDAETDRSSTRARLGWPEGTTVLLHAGAMGAKQGLENVVEASRLADAAGADLLFVLMGDGNQRSELEAMGVNRCLRIIDPLPSEEFLDALRAADVLLVNERAGMTEMAVPSKLTSYFATGLPVVAATDAASVTAQEVALAGAGLRVDAEEPAQLVEAGLRLRDDPALASELGSSGARYRKANLTEEASMTGFIATLHQVGAD